MTQDLVWTLEISETSPVTHFPQQDQMFSKTKPLNPFTIPWWLNTWIYESMGAVFHFLKLIHLFMSHPDCSFLSFLTRVSSQPLYLIYLTSYPSLLLFSEGHTMDIKHAMACHISIRLDYLLLRLEKAALLRKMHPKTGSVVRDKWCFAIRA